MQWIKQISKKACDGRVLLAFILGLLCIVYLGATKTSEDLRLIDVLKRYCYAHYAMLENPSKENENRFLRFEGRLARLSKGKFSHLNEEEVKRFFEPRGYAFDVQKPSGKVDYLLARFPEAGYFDGAGPELPPYDYFILDEIFVYPYYRYYSNERVERWGWSPLVLCSRYGCLYLDGRFVRTVLTRLFTRLWEVKVSKVSEIKGPQCYKVLYRGLEEIWKDTHSYHTSERGAREYFVKRAFESYAPVMLACVSREHYYRERLPDATKSLEVSYLKSLSEDPDYITLGLLYYLNDVKEESWAQNVVAALKSEGLDEFELGQCSLGLIRWAAQKAFQTETSDLV